MISLDAPHRNYRDDNHKPEAHLALTDFWMLHGFRPAKEIAELLESIPEFHPLLAGFHDQRQVCSGKLDYQSNLPRDLYAAVMRMPQLEVNARLRPLCERLENQPPANKDQPDFWALRAYREFPLPGGDIDRGIFSVYFLNLLRLRPGEGTYQPAGVLHAYLEGTNVEIMANSDNVLRGGLTSKHVDVPELLRILTFEGRRPEILVGEWCSATRRTFRTPAEEFELSAIEVTREQSHLGETHGGADILIMMEGAASIHSSSESLNLPRGGIIFIPHGTGFRVKALTEKAVLYQAGIPEENLTN
jgi:mannose-6-phosphate isomerase